MGFNSGFKGLKTIANCEWGWQHCARTYTNRE